MKPMFLRTFGEAHGVRYDTRQRHGEDFRFAFDLLHAGAKGLLVREPYYLYTKREAGLSRTNVDDRSLIAATAELAVLEDVKRNSVLAALLRRRIGRLHSLAAARNLEPYLMARDYPGILKTVAANPGSCRSWGARLWRKLFRAKPINLSS